MVTRCGLVLMLLGLAVLSYGDSGSSPFRQGS